MHKKTDILLKNEIDEKMEVPFFGSLKSDPVFDDFQSDKKYHPKSERLIKQNKESTNKPVRTQTKRVWKQFQQDEDQ